MRLTPKSAQPCARPGARARARARPPTSAAGGGDRGATGHQPPHRELGPATRCRTGAVGGRTPRSPAGPLDAAARRDGRQHGHETCGLATSFSWCSAAGEARPVPWIGLTALLLRAASDEAAAVAHGGLAAELREAVRRATHNCHRRSRARAPSPFETPCRLNPLREIQAATTPQAVGAHRARRCLWRTSGEWPAPHRTLQTHTRIASRAHAGPSGSKSSSGASNGTKRAAASAVGQRAGHSNTWRCNESAAPAHPKTHTHTHTVGAPDETPSSSPSRLKGAADSEEPGGGPAHPPPGRRQRQQGPRSRAAHKECGRDRCRRRYNTVRLGAPALTPA